MSIGPDAKKNTTGEETGIGDMSGEILSKIFSTSAMGDSNLCNVASALSLVAKQIGENIPCSEEFYDILNLKMGFYGLKGTFRDAPGQPGATQEWSTKKKWFEGCCEIYALIDRLDDPQYGYPYVMNTKWRGTAWNQNIFRSDDVEMAIRKAVGLGNEEDEWLYTAIYNAHCYYKVANDLQKSIDDFQKKVLQTLDEIEKTNYNPEEHPEDISRIAFLAGVWSYHYENYGLKPPMSANNQEFKKLRQWFTTMSGVPTQSKQKFAFDIIYNCLELVKMVRTTNIGEIDEEKIQEMFFQISKADVTGLQIQGKSWFQDHNSEIFYDRGHITNEVDFLQKLLVAWLHLPILKKDYVFEKGSSDQAQREGVENHLFMWGYFRKRNSELHGRHLTTPSHFPPRGASSDEDEGSEDESSSQSNQGSGDESGSESH